MAGSRAGSRISTFISDSWEPAAVQDWDALDSPTSHTAPPFPPIVNPRRAESNDPFHTRSRSTSSARAMYASAQAPRGQPSLSATTEHVFTKPGFYMDSPVSSPLQPRVLAITEIPEATRIISPGTLKFLTENSAVKPSNRQSTIASASVSVGSERNPDSTQPIPIMLPPRPRNEATSIARSKSDGQREPSSRKDMYGSKDMAPTLISSGRRRESSYVPPPAPPIPSVPLLDLDFSEYNKIRLDAGEEMGRETDEKRHTLYRGSVKAGGTIRRHIGTLLGTIKRPRQSGRWGTPAQRDRGEGEGARPYTELRGEEQDDDPIVFDVSSWGPEFAVPTAAAKAMEENKMDPRFAYTGTGEAIDLSNLVGLDHEDRSESDVFSLHRAGTMENSDKNSYYFPPDREIPNWKAAPMRTWFILMLLIISIVLIIGLELLFQRSNAHYFRASHRNCPVETHRHNPLDEENKITADVARKGSAPGLWGFCEIGDLSILAFATWKYIPTLIGVIYGILWKCTDTAVKRAEPYYQLSQGAKGALAASSLNIEYDTFFSLFVPFAALRHRQWVVVSSSVASLLAFAVVPTLLSVVITTTPNQNARQALINNSHDGLQQYDIEKNIVIDGRYTRISEGFLIIIILLGCYVLYNLETRRSGLIGDPSGIAGVAAMANKSHILMDFKELDQASEEKIHKQLNKRTYILHKGALWQAQLLKELERDKNAPKAMNAHPLLLRIKGMIPFMGFTCFVLVITPVMVYVKSWNTIINQAPWFVIGLSIVIKSLWEIVEKDIRMLEPFWQLYKRNADSSVLTLDYTATIPGAIVIKALYKGHFLLAWVAIVTLLIEILTVVMGSLDYSGPGSEESKLSSTLSFALTVIILIILLATMALLLLRRRHTFLPRQPGTISSVLAFIHQSKMLTDFEGTEEKTTLQRRQQLEKIGKTYGFGWFVGRDGERHLGIDQEELLDGYQFGKDPLAGVADKPGSWERYDA